MKHTILSLALIIGIVVVACRQTSSGPASVTDPETPVARDASLAGLPQSYIDAAVAAVPGLVLEEAEDEGGGVYCLHGTANGVFYEVEVDETGKVLEIEHGDDDDDEEDDDDGEEEEEDEHDD